MKSAHIQILPIDDSTMLEVIANASRAGVAIVERAGRIAACNAERIPDGWHRVGGNAVTPGSSYGAQQHVRSGL